MRMSSRLAAGVIVATTFVAGAVTGGVVSRVILDEGPGFERTSERDGVRRGDRDGPDRGRRGDRGRRDGGPRGPSGIMSSRAVDYLAQRLELSDAQRDSLEVILERQREQANAVFQDVGPRLRAVLDSTTTAIRALLEPGQDAEFDAILEEDRGVLGRRSAPDDSTGGG